MADDKTKQDGRDRSGVAGEEPYEVAYLAQKHGISREKAQELIDRHGTDRAILDREPARSPDITSSSSFHSALAKARHRATVAGLSRCRDFGKRHQMGRTRGYPGHDPLTTIS